jgi:predicted protein tyrosine phosphatase
MSQSTSMNSGLQKKRVLFVCRENRVRSATAELMYGKRPDLEVRSAGVADYAAVPLTQEMFDWADQVFVFSKWQLEFLKLFPSSNQKPVVCLNIPDRFDYKSPKLVKKVCSRLKPYLGKPGLAGERLLLTTNLKSLFLHYFVGSVLLLAFLGATIGDASGQIFNLSNGNSAVSVNASSPSGMFNYSVDSINQVDNQWFYYRAGGMTSQASIDSLGALIATQSSARNLSLTYTGDQYTARVVYTLTGGSSGSGQSGLNESVTFINTSSTASLKLSFFDYANFALGGASSGQTLQFGTSSLPPPTHYNNFVQTGGGMSLTASLISGGSPTHVEAATYSQTLSGLNSGSSITLNDNAGPVSGNVSGTFEWDTTLAPGSSLTISELVSVVPEPSNIWLLAFGLAVGAIVSRLHKRNPALFQP